MSNRLFVLSLTLLFIVIFSASGIMPAPASGSESKGAEKMVLTGGKTGNVNFSHKEHQEELANDCTVCHNMFAQEKGVIDKMKAAGSLKGKEVMNKLCIKCHKDLQKQGKESGPTTCTKCHIK